MKILIAGSGGLGREVLSTIIDNNVYNEVLFFNDSQQHYLGTDKIYGKYSILRSISEVKSRLDDRIPFVCAVGHGKYRRRLRNKLDPYCQLSEVVSKRAYIGHFSTFGQGSIIQPNCGISNDVSIGEGVLINTNAQIAHDSVIGNYVSIGSNVVILGNSKIDDFATVYANSTVLPNVRIGTNAVIGAGSVVNRNVAPYETYIGTRT